MKAHDTTGIAGCQLNNSDSRSSSSSSSEVNFDLQLGYDDFGRGYPESRVLVIATGGTICMKRSINGYVPERNFLDLLIPRPSFNDHSSPEPLRCHPSASDPEQTVDLQSLRTPLSVYNRHVRFAVMEFDPLLDSSSINAKGWGEIAQAIARNYQLFDGFVILHGTDSLAYTASALSFMISSLGKPIILTGSQTPMTELQNDATDNLLGALVIAGHFMIPEVCLYFNFKLFRGNRVTKTNAVAFNAFASPNHSPLATVGININVNWNTIARPGTLEPFRVTHHQPRTSHVACLRIFPGILPEMIEGVMKLEGLKGLILETFGSGNAPEDDRLLEVLRNGVQAGIIVVNVTQCMTGSVSPLYAAGTALARTGVVFGMDMTTEAALTKLSVLLSDPDLTKSEIRLLMSKSLRGEITEQSFVAFCHPPSLHVGIPQTKILSPKLAALSALGYAIKKGDEKQVEEVLMTAKAEGVGWLLNEFDYNGNTPMHIAAASPNTSILLNFLHQGASVHIRNQLGRTPLFLAADVGLLENVNVLLEAGAHLHPDEIELACLLRRKAEVGSGACTPQATASGESTRPSSSGSASGSTVVRVESPVRVDIERPGSAGSGSDKDAATKAAEARLFRVHCWDLAGAKFEVGC